ncbi:hypothetical protein [Roseiconus lacunae]|uniref:hypothetical protein n=1 Tax=Roseiconus lacunae TaxID=2605694 RepID=UPI001E4B45B4|nr:hypothetical protein [Roseiconus lacunae]MCD0457880.1 hypothetical protein [Roseiconus lacunae]
MHTSTIEEHFVKTRLKKVLREDTTGAERDRIVGQLDAIMSELMSLGCNGLPPDEFTTNQKLRLAVRDAIRFITRHWHDTHRRQPQSHHAVECDCFI